MEDAEQHVEIVREMVSCQAGLYAYILKLLPYASDAADVLQQVNLKILAKKSEYSAGTNFGAWAASIAHYEVLTHRSKKARDRMVFDDEIVRQLAQTESQAVSGQFAKSRLLEECLGKLDVSDRRLIAQRYEENLRPREIGKALDRSAQSVSQSLYRIRSALGRCISAASTRMGNH